MTSPTKNSYILGRGFASSSRLNLLHFLWKQVVGSNIHTRIPTAGSLRIADIATGTAIWPLDVASEFPTAEVDGFDIALDQCPPKDFLPGVRRLDKWDIFQEPDESMLGQYDIVHVRLIIFVVRRHDLQVVIRNLMKLLKPGGWLQWEELDLSGSHIERGSGNDVRAPAAENALKRVQSVGVTHWTVNLASILKDEGFTKASRDVYVIPPQWSKIFSDMHLMMEDELPMPSQEAREAKLKEMSAISEESKKGAVISTPLSVTVAQKPLIERT